MSGAWQEKTYISCLADQSSGRLQDTCPTEMAKEAAWTVRVLACFSLVGFYGELLDSLSNKDPVSPLHHYAEAG